MNKKTTAKNWIKQSAYNRILKFLPIPCVDLVIVSGRKFLLGKRLNEPAKGQWFFIGGRVFKGETLKEAAIRKVNEELGIGIAKSDLKFLITREVFFRGKTALTNSHMINSVFLLNLNKASVISPDKQHSEVRWFSKIGKNWHPYIKAVLKLTGFKIWR